MANAFLSAARAGRNRVWRYVLCTPAALIFAILILVAVTFLARGLGVVPPDLSAELRHPTHPGVYFIATGVVFLAFLIGFMGAIALFHQRNPARTLGIWSWRDFAVAFGVWVGVQAAATLLDVFAEHAPVQITFGPGFWILLITAAPALAIQTFTEEYVFRGYATQGLLLALRRPVIASVLGGVIFGALHIANGWPQAASALVFGVVLSLTAIRTGGLGFGYGMHLANNLFAGIVVVSKDDIFNGAPGLLTLGSGASPWVDVAFGAFLMIAVTSLFARGAPLAAGRRAGGRTGG